MFCLCCVTSLFYVGYTHIFMDVMVLSHTPELTFLALKTRPEAESILQFENLDDLIKNSLSQSRKVLPNQEEFYRFMFDSGLSSLVRNRLAISKWYKKNWYFI